MPYANTKHTNKAATKQPTKRKAKDKTTDTAASEATASRADIYQRVTDHIVAAIEAGAGKWEMPWHTTGPTNATRPVNAVSKKPYRGVNTLALWIAASDQGYSSNEWATYKQWQEMGAQVRKGEKSSLVVFWKINDRDEEADGGSAPSGEDETGEGSNRRILARGYYVFNASQVDGYTPPALPQPEVIETVQENKRNEEAEAFFASTGASVRHGGSRAFYQKGSDHIQMPPLEAFAESVGYYATLGHETVHWTSAKTRLDRDLSGRFGSEAYAAEELIAELGAAFLCADLGLANVPRPDHAAYLTSWLKVLKNDNRAIFTAASKAQQAADYLHGLREQPEPHMAQQALPPVPML